MSLLFNYPQYIEVNNKKYKINTDFRVAIKCNDISMDQNIEIDEKILAIIYLLFGKEALEDIKNNNELVEKFGNKVLYYLHCGVENENVEDKNKTPDMDFVEDMPYIEASFMSDFGINLENTEMHWWKFYNLINGLSNSEMGNCCVLNRIRNLRNLDLKEIKDTKLKRELAEAKKRVALKKYQPKKKEATEEQLKSAEEFIKAFNTRKE